MLNELRGFPAGSYTNCAAGFALVCNPLTSRGDVECTPGMRMRAGGVDGSQGVKDRNVTLCAAFHAL